MTLNPHVVLAALDSMLETPSTHPGTHLSIMRQRAQRLREQVLQHLPEPSPLVDPLTADEQEFVQAVMDEAHVLGTILPHARKVIVSREEFHRWQRHVGTQTGEPYEGVVMGNVAVVVSDALPGDIAVEEYLAEHGSMHIGHGGARHAFAAGWDARRRHGEERPTTRDPEQECDARYDGDPHCTHWLDREPCCYCGR